MAATINRKIIKPKQTKVKYDDDELKSDKYYQSKAWKKLRYTYLIHNPLCENCLKNGIIKPARDIHHKQFFDENNLMSLCKDCHVEFHRYAKLHNLKYLDFLKIGDKIDFRKI